MIRSATIFLVGLIALSPMAGLAQGLPHTFSPGTPARADEVNENFRYVAPENIVYVSPRPDNTPQENGTLLKSAVNRFILADVNGAPAEDNRYLVVVAPGHYELGTGIVLSDYVDVRGAGPATVLSGSGGNGSTNQALVRAASFMTLSHVSVQAVGAVAVAVDEKVGFRLTDVDVQVQSHAAGGSADGLVVTAPSTTNRSEAILERATISVSATSLGRGVSVSRSTLNMNDVRIVASNAAGATASDIIGISLFSAQVSGNNLQVSAKNKEGATGGKSEALYVDSSARVHIRNSLIEAEGSADETFPLFAKHTSTRIEVHHSIIRNHSDNRFLQSEGNAKVDVGASQLAPKGDWIGSGTVRCVFTYSGDWTSQQCVNLI